MNLTTMTPEQRKEAREKGEKEFLEKEEYFLNNEPSEMRLTYYKGIPKLYKRKALKALTGHVSRKQAIDLKCYDCCGWEELKKHVGGCKATTCPLWEHRPMQN